MEKPIVFHCMNLTNEDVLFRSLYIVNTVSIKILARLCVYIYTHTQDYSKIYLKS